MASLRDIKKALLPLLTSLPRGTFLKQLLSARRVVAENAARKMFLAYWLILVRFILP